MMDGTQELYYINMPSDKGSISPESSYAADEINKAIENLHSDYRIPFRMHVEGFKYEEIAENLNLKLGTVKSRIFFARQKLMSVLDDYNG
jgi:RNA polymerase sigma-70 factor (ECF subfamily)